MFEKIIAKLENLEGEPTAHLSGLKKVFLSNEDTDSQLTQFAYGIFNPGEVCPKHKHPTMEEIFYFLKGRGEYMVGGELLSIGPGVFLRIPANVEHELRNTGDEILEFVYFGIALD